MFYGKYFIVIVAFADLNVIQNFMIGPKVPAMNENAIANMVTDMTFLEGEVARIGRGHLKSSFVELHSVCKLTQQSIFRSDSAHRWPKLFSQMQCKTI